MACAVFRTSLLSPLPAPARTKSVHEDTAIDWARSDYDPYARTKKFCEHMVQQLLPDVSAHHFSSCHRTRRQPPPRNHAI